jgi:3-oxoacyl-[acyl-carrier protein] reductase
MKLKGKVAIITGAGRGLGRAMALALAREGARVTIMSRTLDELKSLAGHIENSGGQCFVFQGDVSRVGDVVHMMRQTELRFTTVDVLINNAAIVGPVRFLADADFTSWKSAIDTNLNGPFYCIRTILPLMIQKGTGKIINITSGLGQMPFPRFCAYSVSKAGITQLTRSLSEELKGRNIQVNAIDPGVMDTGMQEEIRTLGPNILGESVYRSFNRYEEKDQLKDPAEVASLAVFLASPDSDHLTGHYGTLSEYKELGWNK